jgi:hypothetical protein
LKRDERELKRLVKNQPHINSSEFARRTTKRISHSTAWRMMRLMGFRRKTPKKRPFLSQWHKSERIRIAKLNIASNLDWNTIVFTNEKRFNLDGPDCCRDRWVGLDSAVDEEFFSKDYGGYKSLMEWGAVSSEGFLYIHRIHGKLNSESYCEMLLDHAM